MRRLRHIFYSIWHEPRPREVIFAVAVLLAVFVYVPLRMVLGDPSGRPELAKIERFDAPLWPFMAFIGICGAVFVARLIANPTAARSKDESGRGAWI